MNTSGCEFLHCIDFEIYEVVYLLKMVILSSFYKLKNTYVHFWIVG